MAKVKTAHTRQQVLAAARYPALWVSRDLPHRARQRRGVTAPGVIPPFLGACCENAGDIHLRRARQTEARHYDSALAVTPPAGQHIEILDEIAILNFGELPLVESIRPSPDRSAQRFELQGILPPALLEDTQRIADRCVRILVFAGPDDALDKLVLLIC